MKQRLRNKPRLAERRAEAAVRNAEHALLSPQEKLAKLDARLGKGIGATKEREHLTKLIVASRANAAVNKETAEGVFGVAETKKGKKAKKSASA